MIARLFMKIPVPPRARVLGAQVLCSTFARALNVEPPRLARLGAGDPEEALRAFRAFSAACMEEALRDPAFARERRAELRRQARDLGLHVRAALRPRDRDLAALLSRLYHLIGIEVEGEMPGALTFRRCYFSERYTPKLCAFMSAFDDGFASGLAGGTGRLAFHARITEGCACCAATFEREGLTP